MGEILFKIWYMIFLLPLFIFQEGWAKFSKFLDHGNRRAELNERLPFLLLAVLVLLLIILLLLGYPISP